MEQLFITASDGLQLSATLMDIDSPKALVQIIHGSVEHKERYYEFGRHLNNSGYAVIISDNRGHGASLDDLYTLGYMQGFGQIIDDQHRVGDYIRKLHTGSSLYLLGHSFGSVLARIYLQRHDADISKLVLSGTVCYNPFVSFGIFISKAIILLSGERSTNKFLRSLVLNTGNAEWVSMDKMNLEKYRADPLCGYAYTNSAAITIMLAVKELRNTQNFECNNPDLPILSVSGHLDPVTGGKRGLADTFNTLAKIGYHNFEEIIYPGMKHEVLNEKGKLQVFDDIVKFFDNELPFK